MSGFFLTITNKYSSDMEKKKIIVCVGGTVRKYISVAVKLVIT